MTTLMHFTQLVEAIDNRDFSDIERNYTFLSDLSVSRRFGMGLFYDRVDLAYSL